MIANQEPSEPEDLDRLLGDADLLLHKWDPATGASLRTLFIGQCMRQFLNVYKVWLRDEQEHRALQQVVDADDLSFLAGGVGEVEHEVVTKSRPRTRSVVSRLTKRVEPSP